MEQFHLITSPEQAFYFREQNSEVKAVISLNMSEDFIGRIVPYFLRKKNVFSIFWHSSFSTPDSVIELINKSEVLFLTEDYFVKYFRKTLNSKVKIALFSSATQIKNVEFFKKYGVLPIVSSSKLVDFCENSQLESIFFYSSKKCIASQGTCISKNGTVQSFINCDLRCRERATSFSKIDFPFSLGPSDNIPKNLKKVLVFTEDFQPKTKFSQRYVSEFLEKNWNYHFSIGNSILASGKFVSNKRFFFKTNQTIVTALKEELAFFWGYTGNIFKGRKIQPKKLFWKEENKNFFILINENFEKVLLLLKYDIKKLNEIKTARHFLTTLPQQKVFARKKMEEFSDKTIVKKVSTTILTDDLSKVAVFKSGFAKRVVYTGNLDKMPKKFNGFALVLDIDSVNKENLRQLRGVVVINFITYEFFKDCEYFSGEILFHPLYTSRNRKKPWLLTNSLSIFISDFISEKHVNYAWKKEFTKMTNDNYFSVFYKERKFIIQGNIPELWIDISKTDSKTALFLKKQSEQILFSIKKPFI